jgi:hypothetical protein
MSSDSDVSSEILQLFFAITVNSFFSRSNINCLGSAGKFLIGSLPRCFSTRTDTATRRQWMLGIISPSKRQMVLLTISYPKHLHCFYSFSVQPTTVLYASTMPFSAPLDLASSETCKIAHLASFESSLPSHHSDKVP